MDVGWLPNAPDYPDVRPYGIHLENGSGINFSGTVAAPVNFVRCNTLQEDDVSVTSVWAAEHEENAWSWGPGLNGIDGSGDDSPSAAPTVNASFLRCSCLADADNDGILSSHIGGSIFVNAMHSEFWGGNLGAASGFASLNLTNCLFDACNVSMAGQSASDNSYVRFCDG